MAKIIMSGQASLVIGWPTTQETTSDQPIHVPLPCDHGGPNTPTTADKKSLMAS